MKTKHLLNGVAVAAVLVMAAPVWAQTAGGNSSGGNSMAMPGRTRAARTFRYGNSGSFGGVPSPEPASTSAAPPAHHTACQGNALLSPGNGT